MDVNAQEPQTATAEFQPTAEPQADPAAVQVEKDRKLDLLMDLTLPVSIELGRTNLALRDILINGKKMAEGEVVVIEKHFGIRITNLVEASERVKGLGK